MSMSRPSVVVSPALEDIEGINHRRRGRHTPLLLETVTQVAPLGRLKSPVGSALDTNL